jgi:hypothetical protein
LQTCAFSRLVSKAPIHKSALMSIPRFVMLKRVVGAAKVDGW